MEAPVLSRCLLAVLCLFGQVGFPAQWVTAWPDRQPFATSSAPRFLFGGPVSQAAAWARELGPGPGSFPHPDQARPSQRAARTERSAEAVRTQRAGAPKPTITDPVAACREAAKRHVDAIVFGDEPAGILTALELSRQWRFRRPQRAPRLLLLTDADTRLGLGGTVARGWLAYLDRNQVPTDLLGRLPPFAPSSELYARFLRQVGVHTIAIDPEGGSNAFRRALRAAGIAVWDRVILRAVQRQGDRLCVLETANHGSVGADLVIDASLGAVLAHAAGAPFQPGLGRGRIATRFHASSAIWLCLDRPAVLAVGAAKLAGEVVKAAPGSHVLAGERSEGARLRGRNIVSVAILRKIRGQKRLASPVSGPMLARVSMVKVIPRAPRAINTRGSTR